MTRPARAAGLRLEVHLWIAPGEADGFHVFEGQAMAIMEAHGGAVTARPGPGAPGAADEIHNVTFPDAAAFAAYREDPRLVALAALRARSVARTEIVEMGEPPLLDGDA